MPGGERADLERVDDVVLVTRVQDGDLAAFEVLARRHSPAMTRYAHRMLGDAHLAEEAVQDALLAAWQHIDGFRGDSSVLTWLMRITTTRGLNLVRRRVPVPASDQITDTAADPDTLVDPERRAITDDLVADLVAALGTLPERQRSVWLLREVEGMSYEDIAEVLSTTPTVVRGQLHRGRRALAERMWTWR